MLWGGGQVVLQGPHMLLASRWLPSRFSSSRITQAQPRGGATTSTPILVAECKDEGIRSEGSTNNVGVVSKNSKKTKAAPTPAAAPSPVTSLNAAAPPTAVSSSAKDETTRQLLNPVTIRIPVGNREIVVETGLIGRQANGAVTVTDGETMLYTTVCASTEPSEPSDFIPLTVNYQERFSAAGRTSGGFIKREGRARDNEILVCRLIDRPVRPLIANGFNHETQILVWVLSYDKVHAPEPLAITSAGAALALSDIPMSKPMAGVRVGLVDGQMLVNPTVEEMGRSTLDMIVAGTADAVLMIEGYCDFLTEETLLQAVEVGHGAVKIICKELQMLADMVGKPKNMDAIQLPPSVIKEHIQDLVGAELEEVLQINGKQLRGAAIRRLEDRVLGALTEEGICKELAAMPKEVPQEAQVSSWEEEELIVDEGLVDEGDVHVTPVPKKPILELFDPVHVKRMFKELSSDVLRRLVIQKKVRSDGRGATDIRQIQSMCGLLPRAHGSVLFTRGETQTLAVATLGGDDMGQRIDNLTNTEDLKRFYLQYTFPPSCVGEVGRMGAPSRREIGHGTLAERALEPVIPDEADFPYAIRLESTITESNGSSSMASVCGGCLAMMDAGVPLKGSVAGVAMGLILNTREWGGDGDPVILSDILGSEDALGDMDFKVAGNEYGVTAFQMDIKVEGITIPVMQKALLQANAGRRHILAEMGKCSPPPAGRISEHAPLIELLKTDAAKLNLVIGAGGKTIKSIIESTGVESVDVSDDGSIRVVGRSVQSMSRAKAKILGLITVPKVGTIYRDCRVKNITSFGCFVEIFPGKEGLCHISELSNRKLVKVEDFVNEGDLLDVKLIEINARGQLRLSHRATLDNERVEEEDRKPELAS
ncbi:unnamed protein product, partial [Sphagnum jensenii]